MVLSFMHRKDIKENISTATAMTSKLKTALVAAALEIGRDNQILEIIPFEF